MKLTKKQHLIYDILISTLACTAVVFVLMDFSDGLSPWQMKMDRLLLAIFVIDYLVRFYLATNKRKFMRANVCDLIAIIPLHTIFRAFKIFRIPIFLRILKMPRMFAFLYRPLRKAKVFFNTNGFKYVVFITALLIMVGGVLIHFAEGMSLSDGVWWAFVTATTVGYGDISPSTFYGRTIAMVLMLVGIGLIGTVTSTITSYFLKAKNKDVSSETLEMIKRQLDDFASLTEGDVETICGILRGMKKH